MESTTLIPNAVIPEFLNHKNYEQWSLRVKTYLLAEDLWEVVKPPAENTPQPKPADGEEYKAWTRKNAKALHVIHNSCGSDMLSVISKTDKAESAWEALENECKEKQKAENDAKEYERYIPFADYVAGGNWEKAKELILTELPDAVRARDPRRGYGDTALHLAAREGHVHIVKGLMLLMTQEDLQIKNVNGSTALHSAVKTGDVDIVKELVPVIGEIKDSDGDTVLHIAVKRRDARIVKELVKLMRKEDMEIRNNDCQTALYIAVQVQKDPLLVKELLPYDAFDRYIPFTNYVIQGDWENANECLRELDPYNAVRARDPRDGQGNTALHIAVRQGRVNIVKELVFRMTQEDLEVKSADAFTGNLNTDMDEEVIKMAQHMVEQNEKMLTRFLELTNAFGDTPLHEAVGKKDVHIVKELVPSMRQQGFEVKNDLGSTALHVAVSKEHVHIVKELVPAMRQQGFEVIDALGSTALHLAVMKGNVDIVKELVPVMRQEGLEVKDARGSNALHRAAKEGHVDIVKELVSSMRPEALETTDHLGHTALSGALDVIKDEDVMKIAKHMAGKNSKLFGFYIPGLNYMPVAWACSWNKLELVRYLYYVTPHEVLSGKNGAYLITVCIKRMRSLDIAWDLLHRYPRLAFDDEHFPMLVLARMHYAFLSGKRLTLWQKWIYHSIQMESSPDLNTHDDISINVSNLEDDQGTQKEKGIRFSVKSLCRIVKDLLSPLGINTIYEMKATHIRISKFLRYMGEVIKDGKLTSAEFDIVTKSIFKAIEKGHVEFVTQMCKENPKLVDVVDEKKRTIFHFAIERRQEEIYSFIYELEQEKRTTIASLIAKSNNNMLHSAANLSPQKPLDRIQGASLQMQRELQWFKEVESIVPFDLYESLNHSDELTARELFTINHKNLMEEAEKSMKHTASSCTVVGSLIATMMFAAAFTVPGGNNGDTGIPMFIDQNLFHTFIISDILSLVSSTSSVIIFLGLLTSRYAEDDYLKSLPRTMMIGLFTLFVSIATMMIAFCSAIIIVVHGKYSWIVVPSIFLGSVPIACFLWVQFPLLLGTFISTYGPGIFDRRTKPWYKTLMQGVLSHYGFATSQPNQLMKRD